MLQKSADLKKASREEDTAGHKESWHAGAMTRQWQDRLSYFSLSDILAPSFGTTLIRRCVHDRVKSLEYTPPPCVMSSASRFLSLALPPDVDMIHPSKGFMVAFCWDSDPCKKRRNSSIGYRVNNDILLHHMLLT